MGLGGIVGWGGKGGAGGDDAPLIGQNPVDQPFTPNYGTQPVAAPAGYQPIAGQNNDYSGGSSNQPTIASTPLQQFAANPRGYVRGQVIGGAMNAAKSIFGGGGQTTGTSPPADVDAPGAEGSQVEGTDASTIDASDDASVADSIGDAAESLFAL
jgi:hypothetical protein